MIPKILHRIWLGGKPMPEEQIEYGNSWQRNHPEWSMILWTEEMINSLDLVSKELYYSPTVKWNEKCDLLRYEILYQFGGVYVDTDMLSVKPIDTLIENTDQFVSLCRHHAGLPQPEICNAILGCSKNNQYFKKIVEDITPSYYAHMGDVGNTVGVHFLKRHSLPEEEMTKFPWEFFYPFLWFEPWMKPEECPEAYAIHYWGTSWW